jgi:hypothetical protein
MTDGGGDDLVCRIAVEGLRQFAAFNQNIIRQLGDIEAWRTGGQVKPLVERAIQLTPCDEDTARGRRVWSLHMLTR